MNQLLSLLLIQTLLFKALAFTPSPIKKNNNNNNNLIQNTITSSQSSTSLYSTEAPFEIDISMPPSNSGLVAQMQVKPLSSPSQLVEVRYPLPFELSVEPQNGQAVFTKAGTGGELPGDILRFSSQWTMGLPRGNGLISTAASFSGAIGWQCSLFDVMKASNWNEVVEALVSNTPQRTDEVVLLFERPMKEEA